MRAMIDIVVNGKPRRIVTGTTIIGLLEELGISSGKVAVERNREVVPKSQHGATLLQDGDALEIVTFVGGG